MEPAPGFAARIFGVIRQKRFVLILMLAVGEIAIWLSGSAGLGLMLLLAVAEGCAAMLGAVVRVWLEGRHKEKDG